MRHQYRQKRRVIAPALNPAAIGRRVRAARKARGWRQLDLSMKTGIHPSVVGLYETGDRVPTRDAGFALCVALRRSLEWLYFGVQRNGKIWKMGEYDD